MALVRQLAPIAAIILFSMVFAWLFFTYRRKWQNQIDEMMGQMHKDHQTVLNHMDEGYISFGSDLLVSEHSASILNFYKVDEVKGKDVIDLLFQDGDIKEQDKSKFRIMLETLFTEKQDEWNSMKGQFIHQLMVCKENEIKNIQLNYKPLFNEQGVLDRVIVVVNKKEVYEKQELQKQPKKSFGLGPYFSWWLTSLFRRIVMGLSDDNSSISLKHRLQDEMTLFLSNFRFILMSDYFGDNQLMRLRLQAKEESVPIVNLASLFDKVAKEMIPICNNLGVSLDVQPIKRDCVFVSMEKQSYFMDTIKLAISAMLRVMHCGKIYVRIEPLSDPETGEESIIFHLRMVLQDSSQLKKLLGWTRRSTDGDSSVEVMQYRKSIQQVADRLSSMQIACEHLPEHEVVIRIPTSLNAFIHRNPIYVWNLTQKEQEVNETINKFLNDKMDGWMFQQFDKNKVDHYLKCRDQGIHIMIIEDTVYPEVIDVLGSDLKSKNCGLIFLASLKNEMPDYKELPKDLLWIDKSSGAETLPQALEFYLQKQVYRFWKIQEQDAKSGKTVVSMPMQKAVSTVGATGSKVA